MDMPTKKEAIIVLAAIATIFTSAVAFYRAMKNRNNNPIDILLLDNQGYPCTDVRVEVGDLRFNPDGHGRVRVAGKYLGLYIMIFEASTGRLLLTTKLEKVDNESTIRIIISNNELKDD